MSSPLNFHLEHYDGPLDLLLDLIRKQQIDIKDIPIATITSQYLEYMDKAREMDIDLGAEFVYMAATLIHIKSRLLLPRPAPEQATEDEEDPRDALVRRLVAHQQFKAAAEMLHERETVRSAQWTRSEARLAEIAGEAPEPELEVDLFSLMSAFKAVLTRAKQRPQVVLPGEFLSIEARIEQLLARLSTTEAIGFAELFDDVATRAELVVTFLALLEMIRLKVIRVYQTGPFGDIRIYRRQAAADNAPHYDAAPGTPTAHD